MAPKMVASFRRSLSFPNQPSYTAKPRKIFRHFRSTSLPCRSHPIISQLKDEINELKAWGHGRLEFTTSEWLCQGLTRLKSVQESLDDLLQLPQTRESLQGHSALVEVLLEDFLRFVDVYGTFQTLTLTLKEEYLSAEVAVRRKDETKIVAHMKNLNKVSKEMSKLGPVVQAIGEKYLDKEFVRVPDSGDAELTDVIKDVIDLSVHVSIALFNGLSASLALRKPTCMGLMSFTKKLKKAKIEEGIQEFQELLENLWGLKKKAEEEVKIVCKRMHELEDSIVGIETCGEKAFRSLINSRVSLLNVLT